jgi:hypothetical protein
MGFKNGTHAALKQSQQGLKKEVNQQYPIFNGLLTNIH